MDAIFGKVAGTRPSVLVTRWILGNSGFESKRDRNAVRRSSSEGFP